MPSIIQEILESEFRDGYSPTNEQSDLIEELVQIHPNDNYCELFYSAIKGDYDHHKLASFFSMLFWATPDNGSSMFPILEKWAISDNQFKVKVAHSDELEVVLENVKERVKS